MFGSRTFKIRLPEACGADATYISDLLQQAGFPASVAVYGNKALCSLEKRFPGETIRHLKKYLQDAMVTGVPKG